MNITEQEMREFVGKFFPSKELNYASDECIQIQAGEQFGIPMHYEYHLGTVALHLEQKDWRAIRNHLNANLHNERLIPSNWFGRNNCQWTIDGEIHTVHDMFQAFLDIRSIIEPVIEQFEGKEPQDYSHYTLDESERLTTESKTPAKAQEEINLTLLADKEMVVLYDTKIANIQFVSAALCGGWMGTSVIPEVYHVKRNKEELTVQMHLYADNYCKGVQLLLKQNGDDIFGKIEWAKGTKRRAERNERIEKILQSDWNDTSDADVANLDTNIPIGKKGYGVEKIIVEIEPQKEVSKEEAKEQDAKPEVAKETKNEKVKCPNCGAESAGKFCPECGTPLVKAAEAPLQEQKREKVVSSRRESTVQPLATNKKETFSLENTLHTQLEKKIKEVKQVPVHLEERYHQGFKEEELSSGLSFDNPKNLYELDVDSFSLKNELFTAIEKAASRIDGYSSEAKANKRAAENFRQVAGNPKIQKGKMIFAECVEERIIRTINPIEQVVGQECERLKKTPSYESPYDVPYDEKTDENQIFNYEIREDGAREKCHVCNGEKIERCPKCDGSGREQYIDSYFASGEPKYKTGQCSRCYGKGYFICRHCDGSGLEFKGYENYANVRSYKEKRFYNSVSYGISPWGNTSYINVIHLNDCINVCRWIYRLFDTTN